MPVGQILLFLCIPSPDLWTAPVLWNSLVWKQILQDFDKKFTFDFVIFLSLSLYVFIASGDLKDFSDHGALVRYFVYPCTKNLAIWLAH